MSFLLTRTDNHKRGLYQHNPCRAYENRTFEKVHSFLCAFLLYFTNVVMRKKRVIVKRKQK